jgi:peptidoglycan/xylan/chitin deacetylase (PgdA/CDA1 family)
VLGQQVGPNLSLVREVAAAGHTITNPTWSHDECLPGRTYVQLCDQIDRCNDALAEAGQHPTIFRAPGGKGARSPAPLHSSYACDALDDALGGLPVAID